MTLVRHFTATAFVVHDDCVALHWHRKVKAWLPPGGHIEENEDPVQAALREVYEETGLRAEVVPTSEVIELQYPTQVLPPFTIMVEDIDDPVQGFHHHIDMIYFCRLTGPAVPLNDGWRWVSRGRFGGQRASTGRVKMGGRRLRPRTCGFLRFMLFGLVGDT